MIEEQCKFLLTCYSWIQVSDLHSVGGHTLIFYLTKKGAIPQSNNTLLQVHFYIKFGQRIHRIFKNYTVKVLSLAVYESWTSFFEIQKDTFMIPLVYYWE